MYIEIYTCIYACVCVHYESAHIWHRHPTSCSCTDSAQLIACRYGHILVYRLQIYDVIRTILRPWCEFDIG